jgi:hypothetical protein
LPIVSQGEVGGCQNHGQLCRGTPAP